MLSKIKQVILILFLVVGAFVIVGLSVMLVADVIAVVQQADDY